MLYNWFICTTWIIAADLSVFCHRAQYTSYSPTRKATTETVVPSRKEYEKRYDTIFQHVSLNFNLNHLYWVFFFHAQCGGQASRQPHPLIHHWQVTLSITSPSNWTTTLNTVSLNSKMVFALHSRRTITSETVTVKTSNEYVYFLLALALALALQ